MWRETSQQRVVAYLNISNDCGLDGGGSNSGRDVSSCCDAQKVPVPRSQHVRSQGRGRSGTAFRPRSYVCHTTPLAGTARATRNGIWNILLYTFARGRVLLKKLTVTQLAKRFPAFYGTRMLTNIFMWVYRWSQSKPVQSIPRPYLQLISTVPSYRRLYLQVSSFLS
jgi:hypothetical protein